MIRPRTLLCVAALLALLASVTLLSRPARAEADGVVSVAMLRYGPKSKTSVCFSGMFLRDLQYETGINVSRNFADVKLGSEELFEHPFAIMSGDGTFDVSAEEVENLRQYITRGGFLLASAGCSDAAWGAAMKRTLERAFPNAELKELPLEHEVFQTVWDITEFQSKKRRREIHIYGIEIDNRLAVVFSPEGLNDTQNAGGGCCCCGG
ncbi:MAG: DUF4159 domain-containing protein, partial [Phycisphaerales bacterium]|nr:DUF4159 domain-containing protein [Phycisphaerales bacterium]